jgi:hypothetical protein
MLMFEEYQLLVALASVFPAPTPPLSPALLNQALPPAVVDRLRVLPPFSLLLTGNQVDVRQQTPTLGASAALRLALYREPIVQPLTSVIISSNRLYGGMTGGANIGGGQSLAASIPAALMTMMRGTPCSVTGNVIINRGIIGARGSAPEGAPSLWLVVSESAKDGTVQLAVTGNVLQGLSNLARLARFDAKPLDTWSPLNADPA